MTPFRLQFDGIFGQQPVKQFFEKAFTTGRLAHSYLFVGPRGVGKLAMALKCAQIVLCSDDSLRPCGTCKDCKLFLAGNHPNIKIIFPHPRAAKEKELTQIMESILHTPYAIRRPWASPMISIEAVRSLRRDLGLTSQGGLNRVTIINDAHAMTAEAGNALLKTLEEPPPHSYFFLLTPSPDHVLPTIQSRCQVIRFRNLAPEEIEAALEKDTTLDASMRQHIARLANGSLSRAMELLQEDIQTIQQDAIELLRNAFRNPSQRAVFLQGLVRKHDRKYLREILESLLLWLRDAFHRSCTKMDDPHPAETETVLQKFVQSYPDYRFIEAMAEIDKSIHMLDRYVHPMLVFHVLLIQLRRFAGQEPKSEAA